MHLKFKMYNFENDLKNINIISTLRNPIHSASWTPLHPLSAISTVLTIVARRPRVRGHVALARVRVPLLHAHAPIGARILAALGRSLAAVHHQRAGHHRVLGQLRRRIGQVQRRQTALEAGSRRNRRRQLGVHVLEHAAHVQNALQLHVHIVARCRVHFDRVVDDQRVRLGGRPPNADAVPAIVVHVHACLVAQRDRPVAQIEDVVHVAVHQLDGYVVGAPAAIVQQQTVGLQRLEAEIDEDGRVGFQHGQPDVRVLRAERGRMIDGRRRRRDEAGGQLEAGAGQCGHLGAQRFDQVDVAGQLNRQLLHCGGSDIQNTCQLFECHTDDR